ncbi:anti-sigma factor family protein [Castellaniella sp.]|jgi:anti-sigma factor RsiW|uniref:anti-sigma factor family protein n=1 Tax=Castellaniella sp. TaxID=1955812 RepID=UPI003C757116
MPCPRTVLLSSWLDGPRTPRRRALIQAHLQTCPLCSGELAALRGLSDALHALPDPLPGLDLARPYRRRRSVSMPDWRAWVGGWPAGLAVAASLALGLGLGAWSGLGAAPGQAAPAVWMSLFDPVPPGGLCAPGLCGTPEEHT